MIDKYSMKKFRNYKLLTAEFFEFYENFDFYKKSISVVDGRAYDFDRVSHIPDMARPMSVSSVLENNVNAAKIISNGQLEKFQRACANAANIIYNSDF